MSLAINPREVTAILLPVTGWLTIVKGSFDLDAYEIIDPGEPYNPELDHFGEGRGSWEDRATMVLHTGDHGGICGTGFICRAEDGATITGPLTSILAVETREEQ